ncbi:hypothetical protein HNY73_019142 [Argiope bruennichi]|uniref:Uncharacterized protein n=1 Tax=Argiope bruennichi TaxID=94029 RepID=A0A8T0EGC4_ARGBR|nr:hypothetical protein HNY73_019142 [Argiope bruennichi]
MKLWVSEASSVPEVRRTLTKSNMQSLFVFLLLAAVLACALAQYWPYAALPYRAAVAPYVARYPYVGGLYAGGYWPYGYGYTAAWGYK